MRTPPLLGAAIALGVVGALVEALVVRWIDGQHLDAMAHALMLAANCVLTLALAAVFLGARALLRAADLDAGLLPLRADPARALRQLVAGVFGATVFMTVAVGVTHSLHGRVRTPLFLAISVAAAMTAALPLALVPALAVYRVLDAPASRLSATTARRTFVALVLVALLGVAALLVAAQEVIARVDLRPGMTLLVPAACLVGLALWRPRIVERAPLWCTLAFVVALLSPLLWTTSARGPVALLGWQSSHLAGQLPAGRTKASPVSELGRLFPPPQSPAILEPAKHLVLVSVDALRADHLPSYGYARPTAPEVERFFDGGGRVERCYTVIPGTIPAIVSLNTGLYPYRMPWTRKLEGVGDEVTTLAEMLKAQGFATTYANYMYYVTLRGGLDQGFDRVLVNPITHAGDKTPKQMDHFERDGPMMDAVEPLLASWSDVEQRHFLWVHFVAPHEPYLAHEGMEPFGKRPIDRYDTEIQYFDRQFARLIEGLKRAGVLDETLLILVADHGEAFGEHGKRYHGHTLYEEDIRVPCLVRGPGVRAVTIAEAGSLIDVVPTALDLLGLKHPTPFDGVSWAASLTQAARLPERTLITRRVRVGRLKPDAHATLRDHKKTLFDPKLNVVGSWDLDQDPGEKKRLADAPWIPEATADLRTFLEAMKAGTR